MPQLGWGRAWGETPKAFIRSMRPSRTSRTRRHRLGVLFTVLVLAGLGSAAWRLGLPLYEQRRRERLESEAVRVLAAVEDAQRALLGHTGHYTADVVEIAGITSKLAIENPERYAVFPTGAEDDGYVYQVGLIPEGFYARATPLEGRPPRQHLLLISGRVHVADGRPARTTDTTLPSHP